MSVFRKREHKCVVFMHNHKRKYKELEARTGSLQSLVSRIAEYLQLPAESTQSYTLSPNVSVGTSCFGLSRAKVEASVLQCPCMPVQIFEAEVASTADLDDMDICLAE